MKTEATPIDLTREVSGLDATGRGGAALDIASRARVRVHRPPSARSIRLTKSGLCALDLLAVAVAMGFALRAAGVTGRGPTPDEYRYTILVSILSLPIWALFFIRNRLYQVRFIARRVEELRRAARAVGAGAITLFLSGELYRERVDFDIQRDFIAYSFAFALLAVMVEREVVRQVFSHLRQRGSRLRPVVIVGTNLEALELKESFEHDPSLGYSFAGFVSVDPFRRDTRTSPHDILGSVTELHQILADLGVRSVMIAASAVEVTMTNHLIRRLLKDGIHVELSPTLPDVAVERLTIRPLGRFPVMYLEPFHQSGWRSLAKRIFDMFVATVVILVLSVPLALVTVAIKIDSSGPVFFRQRRVGKDGREFEVLKFRTMVVNAHELRAELMHANEADGPLFKIRDDPRITRIGSVLRKFSIDELPQLWNVLAGDMSLVGPRPALPEEAAVWSDELRERLRVKPGITGMWQVSGRSDTSFAEYSRLDLYYVDNWSLLTDITILGKTVPTVLTARGAA